MGKIVIQRPARLAAPLNSETIMSFSGRIGLLAPSSNTTVEPEFYRALPQGVSLHNARLPITQVTPDSIGKMADSLDVESKLLATADVDVII